MQYQLKLDPSIKEIIPGYMPLIIYASNLKNQPSNEYSTQVLRQAENEQRETFGTQKLDLYPHILACRQAFKNFGAKPKKYLCSVEALLSRTFGGDDLPNINCLVDLYNAVSIRHVIPLGGEDWDKLTSDLTLTVASGKEPFVIYQKGEEVTEYPNPGELIWLDSSGVTCRRWNWRQCHRTALTVDTCNAYLVLDCLPPYSKDQLIAAGDELIMHLKNTSPDCKINQEILRI